MITDWLFIFPLFLAAFMATSLLADWLCHRITGRALLWRRANSVWSTMEDDELNEPTPD